jgi:hypothetical protein
LASHDGSRRVFLGASLALVATTLGCRKEPPLDCSDISGLKPAERKQRDAVTYLDASADPTRTCQRCLQWVAPAAGGCGSCKLVPGPVHPLGTCRLFALKG